MAGALTIKQQNYLQHPPLVNLILTTDCQYHIFNFNFIKFVIENVDSQTYVLPNNDERCREKNFVILQIFFADIVSKTLQETNSFSIKENSLLANHITSFEKHDTYIRNVLY